MEDTLTMEGEELCWRRGMHALVVLYVPRRLVSTSLVKESSVVSVMGIGVGLMPAQLKR